MVIVDVVPYLTKVDTSGASEDRVCRLLKGLNACVGKDGPAKTFGLAFGITDLSISAERASDLLDFVLCDDRRTLLKHCTALSYPARLQSALGDARRRIENVHNQYVWCLGSDLLHPSASLTAPDAVPLTFCGGVAPDEDERATVVSALENALNGCIHLETFALDSFERSRRATDNDGTEGASSNVIVPSNIEDPRSLAWGHVLSQNLSRMGSSVEWDYVRRNQMRPALASAMESLRESESQSTRDFALLYEKRISILKRAMSEYMRFVDASYAAEVLTKLREAATEFELTSIDRCTSLEEASVVLHLDAGFDTVVVPDEIVHEAAAHTSAADSDVLERLSIAFRPPSDHRIDKKSVSQASALLEGFTLPARTRV